MPWPAIGGMPERMRVVGKTPFRRDALYYEAWKAKKAAGPITGPESIGLMRPRHAAEVAARVALLKEAKWALGWRDMEHHEMARILD